MDADNTQKKIMTECESASSFLDIDAGIACESIEI